MIPKAHAYWLTRARVPAALLASPIAAGAADSEGLVLLDLKIAHGRIAVLESNAERGDAPIHDLEGGQVWPCFIDLHTHLDKGHSWPRAVNRDGRHATAVATVAADRSHWSEADIAARFEFGLRCAYAHGTSAIRTHLDSYDYGLAETSWAVFRALRKSWRGRIELQAASLATLELYARPGGARLADLVARSEGVLGGATRLREPLGVSGRDDLEYAIDCLFTLAAERGLDLDLHVDETLDPAEQSLRAVAKAALRHRFKGRIVCGHCCNLSTQTEADVAETMRLCRDAGIAIVTLPMVNQYLQGRIANGTPRQRGVTLVHELRANGIAVAAASDNCRDPFFHFGDHDMLEVFREFVRIAHADTPYGDWSRVATTTPADVMGLSGAGRIAIGAPADIVLFRGRGMSELLSRPQSDRIVLRAGIVIDATPPDYRELDSIFR
jgi:cytosine deaminase